MNISRCLKHLAMTDRQVRRAFPKATLKAIGQAIEASEASHCGEVRFVVEGALEILPLWRGQSAHERALELFSQLRIWDTEHNTGVLIYLLLADRQVEIVADRGIHGRAGAPAWTDICQALEGQFRTSAFEAGALAAVAAVTREFQAHFPRPGPDSPDFANTPTAGRLNELTNAPLLL